MALRSKKTTATKKPTTKAKRKPKTVNAKPETDAPKRTINSQLKKYRDGYEAHLAYNQNLSLDNGDDVAKFLRTFAPSRVIEIAEVLLDRKLKERYANLNEGQKRMNSGNLIRNAMKRGDVTMKQVKEAARA